MEEISQFLFQEFSCQTLVAGGKLLWCTYGYNLSTTVATIGSHIDDMVGTLDDFHIVFDDEDGMATLNQSVEGIEQSADVVEMKTGSRLVEDEEGRLLLLLSDEVGQ